MPTKTDASANIAATLGGVVIDESGGEVAENVRTRLIEDTRSITSFDDAIRALQLAGVEPENANDLELVDNKGTLVGVPMVFLQWRFNEDEKGRSFVSVEAVTKDGRKIVFNDGTKRGVRDQLRDLTEDRIAKGVGVAAAHAGLIANAGLRRSDYDESVGAAAEGTSWYVQGLPVARKR